MPDRFGPILFGRAVATVIDSAGEPVLVRLELDPCERSVSIVLDAIQRDTPGRIASRAIAWRL